MFGFFKNLFHKPVEDQADEQQNHQFVTGAVLLSPLQVPRKPGSGSNGNGNGVQVPLQAILSALPLELKAKVKQTEVGDAVITVPLAKVLSQLPRGAVKISFAELRRAAPPVFSSETDRDQIQVVLPLNEILAQINPAMLVRRKDQKMVEVPEDINSPFGERGQGLIFAVGPPKPEAPPAPRAVTPVAPVQPAPAQPTPIRPAPAKPASAQPAPIRVSFHSTPTPPPPSIKPAGLPPAMPAAPAYRGVGAAPVPPAPRPPIAAREPIPAPAKPSYEAPVLSVSLTALAEAWPEAIRHELVQLNLVDAKLALPVEIVEPALKRGKVAFTWKVLRSWIKPSPLPAVSVHDNTHLELPLKVIAPLFLKRQNEAVQSHQKVEIDENIPNLFFGFPQPEAPPAEAAPAHRHAVTQPVDTNYYVWDDTSESARVDETAFKRKMPGTDFMSRYATPNEIVSRAAALDGVAGALIALPDGLMVASKLSPDLNGDTLAAFLPHIFGKVSQCTRELRMGDLNNLNFTVGNVPWKIFRVNAIFFAAFGQAGEPLPTGQLSALAAELDRKNK